MFRVSLTVGCVVSLDMKFRAGHTVGMLVIYMLPPFMAPFFFVSALALMGVPSVRTALGERYSASAIPPESSGMSGLRSPLESDTGNCNLLWKMRCFLLQAISRKPAIRIAACGLSSRSDPLTDMTAVLAMELTRDNVTGTHGQRKRPGRLPGDPGGHSTGIRSDWNRGCGLIAAGPPRWRNEDVRAWDVPVIWRAAVSHGSPQPMRPPPLGGLPPRAGRYPEIIGTAGSDPRVRAARF